MAAPLLVRAARREPAERTPVWFMRQAGRSLPEYRAIRKRHTLFEVCEQPELCAEVTLQPVRRHDVDAAVMFADIMLPVALDGVDVELVEGVGPVVERADPHARRRRSARAGPSPRRARILEAVRIVARELRPDQAVVGFCGGPFTVAGYLVEGKPSRASRTMKALMYREPKTWHALLERLADASPRTSPRRSSGRGRDPALRLLGRRALPGGLRGVRRAVSRRGSSPPSTCRPSTSAPGRRRCSARWRRRAAT